MAKTHYSKIDQVIIKKLRDIVGDQFVITDEEKIEPYSHDEIPEAKYANTPEVVVKPKTVEEISQIIKLANEKLFPITPRGAGSGLSGGAVPLFGGVVLSVERMNKIIEIDEQNMMAVVEPGIVTNDLNDKVKHTGLFFAGYPMSVESCFIGGNVAENAGGGKAVKYGVTERYIIGLEFVTPTGEIVEVGGKRIKDVTGYNLRAFLVGSEGTLGIITKVIIKLLPIPKNKVDLLVLFPDVKSAIKIVPKIIRQCGIIPTAIEFMDKISIHYACKYLNENIPYEKSGSMLLIEVDGSNEQVVEKDYDTIGNFCMDNGAQEVYVADNYTTQERLWRIRRNLGEARRYYYPHESIEDIVVPIAHMAEFISVIKKISKKHDMQIVIHGHAGDGNLHTNIVKNPNDTDEDWNTKLHHLQRDLYVVAKNLGGTISGEHGIGHKRKKFMPLFLTEATLEFMRKIKRAVDPNNILNPGKIFDV